MADSTVRNATIDVNEATADTVRRSSILARILAAFDHLMATGLIDEAAGLTMHMSKRNASKVWRTIANVRG